MQQALVTQVVGGGGGATVCLNLNTQVTVDKKKASESE